jgi:hypothetical protein
LDKLADHKNAQPWEKAFAIGPVLVNRYEKLCSALPEGCARLTLLSDRQRLGG